MMNGSLQERDLGERGLEWIAHSLVSGRELSHRVLATLRIVDGAATTVLPQSVDDARATSFKQGGLPAAKLCAVEVIRCALETSHGASLCVVEDAYSKPTDRWLTRFPQPHIVFGETLLYSVEVPGQSPADLTHFVDRNGSAYPTNAFMIDIAEGSRSADALAKILSGTITAIVVSAYDNESYVRWTVRSAPPVV
jgi:hypothetical protein